ncbi:protein ENHANCED DISEASE RESISTANCE 4 [Cocos nucifera]|uniref:Protein ENHANCED DISEASE RESISTANCE 4 n=1 Tax=Cocos nucifera TaxID=13894 RepID=A0A8K0MZZ8_COCNU|nr:protein ENHANCED DISEASE RESISTANCE 4 [Cocos nucifera]
MISASSPPRTSVLNTLRSTEREGRRVQPFSRAELSFSVASLLFSLVFTIYTFKKERDKEEEKKASNLPVPIPTFRLVRCPGCLKLLLEYADIPVYPCGGCGTTLRAKNRTAAGENVNSRSPEVDHSQSLSDIGASDNGSSSSVKQIQMFACSTSARSSELEHEEKETMLTNTYSLKPTAKCNHQQNGETSGEVGIQENASDTNQVAIRSDASQSQPDDEGVHSETEAEKSLKLSQQPSESSDVMNKVEEPPESVGHSVASEDDMVERGSADALDLTKSSRAYDGSVSSLDDGYNNRARDRYLRLSRRTHRQPKALDTADDKGKEGEADSRSNQITIDVEADLQGRTLSSKLSNERHGSSIMRTHELSRETSFKSEDFHSVQNGMEPENYGPSRSVSRGSNVQHDIFNSKSSKYLRYGRMDLLRKMFELKSQLHGSNQSVGGGKPYLRGTDGQQPLYQKSEHQPPQYFNSNLLHHPPEAIYGPRQVTFRQHQFSQKPFSAQRCCYCVHCCLEDRQLRLQPNHCTDGVSSAHAHKLCSQSSTAGSSGKPDHEQEKLRYNEKRKRKKNHCRPISGGAPFMICYNCFELLWLPADFLISRRRLNKLQCTACSEVLQLSFPAIAHISPQSPSKVVHPCNEVGNCTDVATGSVSRSNDCSRGDSVSFSQVYGFSSTKSFSAEAEPVLHVSRNTSEGRNDKQNSGLPLHQLMGYSSASELLYEYWDFDGGYESIESMIPHSYRPSQERHAIDGSREQRKSTSCHKLIGPCSNPDCMEIHEEGVSSRPFRTRRGSLFHDGLVKEGTLELTHEFESLKF